MANLKTYKCDICGKVYHDESCDKNNRIVVEHWVDDEKTTDIYNDVCTECMEAMDKVMQNPDILENKNKTIAALQEEMKEVDNDKYTLESYINRIYREFLEVTYATSAFLTSSRYYGVHGCQKAIDECFDKIRDLKASKQRWKEAAILLGTWGLMAFILLWFI